MINRVYISGKITGCHDYMWRFDRARRHLETLGYEAVSPAHIIHKDDGKSRGDYMDEALRLMDGCDAVYMLSNWTGSRDALLERVYAMKKKLQILYEEREELSAAEAIQKIAFIYCRPQGGGKCALGLVIGEDCQYCEYRLAKDALMKDIAAAPVRLENAGWACPECGGSLLSGKPRCPACGQRIGRIKDERRQA